MPSCPRLFLATLLIVGVSAAHAAAQTPVDRVIRDVGDLLKKGESETAVKRLQAVQGRVEAPDRARVSNALGYTLFSIGEDQAAVEHLETARATAREQGDRETLIKATNNLGVLEFTRGDLSKARGLFGEAASMGSGFAEDYLGIIDRQERAEKASAFVDAGVQAVRYKQDFAAAIDQYSKALEIDPQDARALNFRGYARFRLGELERAEADLRRAVELDPDGLTPRINLLKVRCALDQPVSPDLGPRSEAEAATYSGDGELRRTCRDRLDKLLG